MSNLKIISEIKLYKYIYNIYLFFIKFVKSNKIIHKTIFGFYPHHEVDGECWAWTTIILKKAMQKYLRSDMSLLDVGTGPVGVLAIYAALNIGCQKICGIDCRPEFVSLAKKNAEKQNLNIPFYESDLFSNVFEKFDLIVLNSPEIDINNRFLTDAPSNLSERGYVILVVNHVSISKDCISKVCIIKLINKSSFEIVESIENSFTQACAYVLKRKAIR